MYQGMFLFLSVLIEKKLKMKAQPFKTREGI